jgi:murein DD-endopeptidase MepM/ murein hydrolase activator NlpD
MSKADLTAAEAKLTAYMDTVPTLWPTSGRVTDDFGFRKDPFTRRTKYHDGIDIGADYGISIKASASGIVTLAERTSGYGLAVKISHGRGIYTLYGHASKLLVKVGQTVKKGDVIAKVGSSGRSTGPHLHFEVLLYGTPVSPLQYLDEK